APEAAPAFDHGRRSRWNARFFERVDAYANRVARDHKAFAFRDLEISLPDHVVELGPGVGANLGYLPAGTRLTAVEPNLAMHPALRARAEERGVQLEVLAQGAERLPFPDASVDVVIATLVLCTVGDPDA
ncbi:class I SAM-dependent methyltransferase, partial [Escherichia coli]|nr:class I SAM-dependent methyltransferase [Escherichia coli]